MQPMPRPASKPKPIPPAPLDFKNLPPFATVAECCVTLRISRATACRYIASGKLQAAKFGRTVRVKTASILALAA
jgi:excisionase family DNA binding protein